MNLLSIILASLLSLTLTQLVLKHQSLSDLESEFPEVKFIAGENVETSLIIKNIEFKYQGSKTNLTEARTWLSKYLKPTIHRFTNISKVEEFVKDRTNVLVIKCPYNSARERELKKAAILFPKASVGICNSCGKQAIYSKEGTLEFPQVDNIEDFLEINYEDIIISVTKAFEKLTLEKIFPCMILFSNQPNPDIQLLKGAAKMLKGRSGLNFFYSSFSSEFENVLGNYAGLTKDSSELPLIAIGELNNENIDFFKIQKPMLEAYNFADLILFAQNWIFSKAERIKRSEELPTQEEVNESLITKIVHKNYDEIIYNSQKDVVVYFYSIDCIYCLQLDPVYIRIASVFLPHNNDFILGKIDVDKNYVEGVPLDVIPLIVIFPAASKNYPVKYPSDNSNFRDIHSLTNFILKHASKSLVTYEMPGASISTNSNITNSENITEVKKEDVPKEIQDKLDKSFEQLRNNQEEAIKKDDL